MLRKFVIQQDRNFTSIVLTCQDATFKCLIELTLEIKKSLQKQSLLVLYIVSTHNGNAVYSNHVIS